MLNRETISKKLKSFRLKKFKSQGEFIAELNKNYGTGLKQTTYSAWENGVSEPSLSMSFKMANILGVTLYDLLDVDMTENGGDDITPEKVPYQTLKEMYLNKNAENKRFKVFADRIKTDVLSLMNMPEKANDKQKTKK